MRTRQRIMQIGVLVLCATLGASAALLWVARNKGFAISESSGQLSALVGMPVAYVFDGTLDKVIVEEDVFPGTFRAVGVFTVGSVVLDGSQEFALLEESEQVQEVPSVKAGSTVRIFLDVAGNPNTWGFVDGLEYRVWTNVLGNVTLNEARATPFVLAGAVELDSDSYLESPSSLNGQIIGSVVADFDLSAAEALLALASDMSTYNSDGTKGPVLERSEVVVANEPAPSPEETRDQQWLTTEAWRRGFEPDVAPSAVLADAAELQAIVIIAPELLKAYPEDIVGLRHSGGVAMSVATGVPISPASVLYYPTEPLELYIGPFDLDDPGYTILEFSVEDDASSPVLLVEVFPGDQARPDATVTWISLEQGASILAASAIDADEAIAQFDQHSETLVEEP